MNTTEQRNDWIKYVQLAAFFHNTYHFAIGTSPTALFHGREPLKPLDLRFNNSSLERATDYRICAWIAECHATEIFRREKEIDGHV